jgi:hypothetical protein
MPDAIIVRTYGGETQAQAADAFARDAQELAGQGYFPVAQSWAEEQWGCAMILLAFLLCFVVVGIPLLIFMLLAKPGGSLAVTYRLEFEPQGKR